MRFNNIDKIPKQDVVQGYDHDVYIKEMFKSIIVACKAEFYEDNMPTLNGFLDECYEKAKEECWK